MLYHALVRMIIDSFHNILEGSVVPVDIYAILTINCVTEIVPFVQQPFGTINSVKRVEVKQLQGTYSRFLSMALSSTTSTLNWCSCGWSAPIEDFSRVPPEPSVTAGTTAVKS